MSESECSVVRAGRPVALAAAGALVLYDVPHFFLGSSVSDAAGRPLFMLHAVAGLAASSLLAVLLVVLLRRCEPVLGHLLIGGLGLAFAGTLLVGGGQWGEAFVVPALRDRAPEIVQDPHGTLLVGLLVSSGVFAAGWAARRRAAPGGRVPARAAVLLGAGAVVGAVPVPGTALFLAAAIAVLAASRRAHPGDGRAA